MNFEVIAEIGTSHQNDLVKAKELLRAAVESGADTVKFQHVYASEIIHENTGVVPLPSGDIKLYEVFKKLETGIDFFSELKEECDSLGVNFLLSVFGSKSLEEFLTLGVNRLKIASPELNHILLLKEIASLDRDISVILSTGVSKLKDIELALEILKGKDVSLFHCITHYPAPEDEYNLLSVITLSNIFGLKVGLSDHSLDPILLPALLKILGGFAVEKHFTLSNKNDGLDDKIALDPKNFSMMTKYLQNLSPISSKDVYSLFDRQLPDSMYFLLDKYSKEKIFKVLGNGVKKLAKSEVKNYFRTSRSIHAKKFIKKGEVFSDKNIVLLRTEKVLKVGLDPSLYEIILGKTAKNDIKNGEGIEFDDLIS